MIDMDPQGKKFDRVSRLVCRSENYEMSLTLDVNVDLLPVEREYKFSIELASTLNLDGTPDSGVYEKRDARSSETRLSGCDYAMHGKVFKYDHVNYSKVAVYMSFGGLLMKLEGDARHLEGAEMDARLYILMKRITY